MRQYNFVFLTIADRFAQNVLWSRPLSVVRVRMLLPRSALILWNLLYRLRQIVLPLLLFFSKIILNWQNIAFPKHITFLSEFYSNFLNRLRPTFSDKERNGCQLKFALLYLIFLQTKYKYLWTSSVYVNKFNFSHEFFSMKMNWI